MSDTMEDEKKLGSSNKRKKGLVFISGLAIIALFSTAVFLLLFNTSEEIVKESDRELMLQESIQLTYDGELENPEDTETPIHYLLSYKVVDNHNLFEEDMVYAYTLDNFTGQFVTNTYKKVEESYILLSDAEEEAGELASFDHKGLTKEEVLKENPSSIIIGEGFDKEGKLVLKESEPIPAEVDIIDNLNYAIYVNSYFFDGK